MSSNAVKSKQVRTEAIGSAYVHIPFCSYKCDFCDFAAFAGLNDQEAQYFDVLKKEIKLRLEKTQSPVNLRSLYFGGGTPGMVPTHYIEEIILLMKEHVNFDDDLEICLETTPHSINDDKLQRWFEMGVRRLSVGIESFDDAELKSIGRDHGAKEAEVGLEKALASSFPVVSIDFMYGLPTQTLESWQRTLNKAVSYSGKNKNLKHISAYGLQLATNSPLYTKFPKDSTAYPDENLFNAMLNQLMKTLTEAGFEHYEVSNFAKPGYQCRHNSNYWQHKPYLAFGVGAHRYVDGWRSANCRSFKRYMRDCLEDELLEFIDSETEIKEAIMLGLRMRKGLDLTDFYKKYGFKIEEVKKAKIDQFLDDGYLAITDRKLYITNSGLSVSNSIIVELI